MNVEVSLRCEVSPCRKEYRQRNKAPAGNFPVALFKVVYVLVNGVNQFNEIRSSEGLPVKPLVWKWLFLKYFKYPESVSSAMKLFFFSELQRLVRLS